MMKKSFIKKKADFCKEIYKHETDILQVSFVNVKARVTPEREREKNE